MSDVFGGGVPQDSTGPVDNSQIETSSFSGGDSNNGGESGNNPAWNDLLGTLPTSLHPVVIPHLQKWDQGVQKRFEQVHSQYNPYKTFVDNGVEPSVLEQSLQLAKMMQDNPRQIYDKMTEFYAEQWGLNGGQGQANDNAEYDLDEEDGNNPQNFDIQNHPEFKRLQEQQQVIAAAIQQEYEQKMQAQAQNEVQAELDKVKTTYGDLSPRDEKIVISLALQNNLSLEKAAEEYFSGVDRSAQRQAPGSNLPPIMAPNGGVPAQHIDPSQMSRQDTKNLVMQMLANVNNPNNQ